jgi:hypothetical protein
MHFHDEGKRLAVWPGRNRVASGQGFHICSVLHDTSTDSNKIRSCSGRYDGKG